MIKLKETIHMEIAAVKPYFTLKNLLLFSAVALFLTAMSDNISSGLGVGMMIATIFVSYPFALSEKSSLDALYTTLAVGRKTVVRGRYLFALLLNACAVLFSFVLAAAGLTAARAAGLSAGTDGGYGEASLILASVFLFIQCIQLPIFFKLGYTKARFISVMPFMFLMSGYLVFAAVRDANVRLSALVDSLAVSGFIIPLWLVTLLAVVSISYCLSMRFYTKREF